MKMRMAKREIRSLHANLERQLEALRGDPEAAGRMGLRNYLGLRVRLITEIAECSIMIPEGAEVVPGPVPDPPLAPGAPVVGDTWEPSLGDRTLTISFVGPERVGVTEPDGEERNINRLVFIRDHRRIRT